MIHYTPAHLTPAHANTLARIGLGGVGREYPNHLAHVLNGDTDVAPPRELHPSFFGCFDWHSAVHTHWMLLKLLTRVDSVRLREAIESSLATSFESDKLKAEAAYLGAPGRQGFERPYGLAWLMTLSAALSACGLPAARSWQAALAPVVGAARENLLSWIPKLRYPIRTGTHNQTAFAFVLLLNTAHVTGDDKLAQRVRDAAMRFYADDRDGPLAWEPSGEDFLSPCLMQAHLLSCLLECEDFSAWLDDFLPGIPRGQHGWLACAQVTDESDGRLVHLHGLNLSRAWNLGALLACLPATDTRRPALAAARQAHLDAGMRAALAASDYAGSHWLPTFAVLAADSCATGSVASNPGASARRG